MRCGFLVLALILAACGSSAADSGRSSTSAGSSSGAPASSTSSSAGAPSPRARCGPAGATTLAAGDRARVYRRRGTVFGCTYGSGRRVIRLGQVRTCLAQPRVGPVAVAGELAAYGSQRCGVDTGTASVVVRRLSDGRILRELSATSAPLGPESYQSVESVVVKPDGAVAWVGLGSSILSHRRRLEVLAAGTGASARVLDAGLGIDSHSLALHGSRLTWSDGGRTRSVSLR